MPPEQAGRRSVGVSEAYREMIELELSRGRNAMGIWQDLVDAHGLQAAKAGTNIGAVCGRHLPSPREVRNPPHHGRALAG